MRTVALRHRPAVRRLRRRRRRRQHAVDAQLPPPTIPGPDCERLHGGRARRSSASHHRHRQRGRVLDGELSRRPAEHEGRLRAAGRVCTGTVIAPRAILTAAHCFAVGDRLGQRLPRHRPAADGDVVRRASRATATATARAFDVGVVLMPARTSAARRCRCSSAATRASARTRSWRAGGRARSRCPPSTLRAGVTHDHRGHVPRPADHVQRHLQLGVPGRLRRPDPPLPEGGVWSVGGVISAN